MKSDYKVFSKNQYTHMLKLDYDGLVSFLNKKYGKVTGSYFHNDTYRSVNKKIRRSKEGLFVHHTGEIEYDYLSNENFAKQAPWKLQLPENLVYCNLIEHTLLHVLISEYRYKQFPADIIVKMKIKPKKYMPYFSLSAEFIKDIINDYDFKLDWMRIVYSQMKPHKNVLIDLYKRVEAEDLLK